MNKNYRLFTGETIDYEEVITFTQEAIENRTISYDCLVVDKENMAKALHSIKHNGVMDEDIHSEGDYFGMLVDYTNIKETIKGDLILILMFDEIDEQKYCLAYKLTEKEKEEFQKLSEEQEYSYIRKLMDINKGKGIVNFTEDELKYIKGNFTEILTSKDEEIIENRNNLDNETLQDMQYILENLNNVNSDESVNKKAQDTIYYALGMYVWVEQGTLTFDGLEDFFADDEVYCSIFDKIMEAC